MKSKSSITTKGERMSYKRPEGGWNITRKPTHPGEMLREEFMAPLDLSANRLAMELHLPVTRITEILNERRAITADTAVRLERYFGMSAEFWLNLQAQFEIVTVRQKAGAQIAAQVAPRPA